MPTSTRSPYTFSNAYALRQAAQNSQSPLSEALHLNRKVVVQFKGFRFRCEWPRANPASGPSDNKLCIAEVGFLRMTFWQAIAHLFGRTPLRRLVAPLKDRIADAKLDTGESILQGLHDGRKATAPREPMDRPMDRYLADIAAIESNFAHDAEARDNALGQRWRTLLKNDRQSSGRQEPLPAAVLDDIRMRVWTSGTSRAMLALRDDQTFAEQFMAAAARCHRADLAAIDEGMALARNPGMPPHAPEVFAGATTPSALLGRIEALPCELRATLLEDFVKTMLGPMTARVHGLPGEQGQVLNKHVAGLWARVDTARAVLVSNTANFRARKAAPVQRQPRRWGPQPGGSG